MKLPNHNILGLVIFSMYMLSKPLKSFALVEDVLDIIHVAKEVTTGVLKAWDVVGQTSFGESIDIPMMREKQRKILKRLKEVTRKIDETNEMHAHQIAAAVDSVEYFTDKNSQIFPKTERIKTVINDISSRYQQMLKYKNYEEALEEQTLISFAEWTVSPNSYSVSHLMDNLHLTLFGAKDRQNTTTNLLTLLAQHYETKSTEFMSTREFKGGYIC